MNHEHEHEHNHGHSCTCEHKHDHEHNHDHSREHCGCHCTDHVDSEHGHIGCGCGHDHSKDGKTVPRLIVGGVLTALALILEFALRLDGVIPVLSVAAAYIILGYDVVWSAVKNIVRGKVFDECFLMTVSTVCAFIIGEYTEAAAVMLFYQLGEYIGSLAVGKTERSVKGLISSGEETVSRIAGDKTESVSPESVEVGDILALKPGERVSVDGIIISGESEADMRALTGESLPVSVGVGDRLLSGSINLTGAIHMKVTKKQSQSTAARIISLVEDASAKKAPTEDFITTFSRYYTPAVVLIAALIALIPPLFFDGLWSEWVRRACVTLVISCPCALVISVPLTYFGSLGAAAKKGILVKGSGYLEALERVEAVVFDKTGTLTKGEFSVISVNPACGVSEEELLRCAAACEAHSTHPIAVGITRYADEQKFSYTPAESFVEISGYGGEGTVDSRSVAVGSERLMQKYCITPPEAELGGKRIFVAIDGSYAGEITLSDTVKDGAALGIRKLRECGVKKTCIFTGDGESEARRVSISVGADEYYSSLLPEDKLERLEDLKKNHRGTTVFVGDGINDSPTLAAADVGIAMGAIGSDAAIESADVVIMTDEIEKISEAVLLARRTKRIVLENIIFSILVKAVFVLLGAVGAAEMWEAVFGDVGVMLIAVLNSTRILSGAEKAEKTKKIR